MLAADFNPRSAIGDKSGNPAAGNATAAGRDCASGEACRVVAAPCCVRPSLPDTTSPPTKLASKRLPVNTATFCFTDMGSLEFETPNVRNRLGHDHRQHTVCEIR